MAIIVQKFGGTSVANTTKIVNSVKKVKDEITKGNKVVVVVSAMAGVTRQLVSFCSELCILNSHSSLAEYDTTLSSGEIVTAALFALALQQQEILSRSLQSWQVPIKTNTNFSKAIITNINPKIICELLCQNIVPVISGFQGITDENRITTLGRGGSDITAVAIAAAINAERCDIYTDVDGVFSADPRLVVDACKYLEITYTEMLEFSALGAKVIHPRAVQIGMRYNVPINIISSFSDKQGTIIKKINEEMEQPKITGVTYDKAIALVNIEFNVDDQYFLILNRMVTSSVTIEHLIYQKERCIGIIISVSELLKAEKIFNELKKLSVINNYDINNNISLISVIGYAIKNDQLVFKEIITTINEFKVLVLGIITSAIKICVILDKKDIEEIVIKLHNNLIKS